MLTIIIIHKSKIFFETPVSLVYMATCITATRQQDEADWLLCERGVPDVLPFSLYSPLKAGSLFQTETFWICLDVFTRNKFTKW